MFGIFVEDAPVVMYEEQVLLGKIIIGDFQETVSIPIDYWNINDYKESWLSSLEHGLGKLDHAVLAVSMRDPESTNFVFVWTLYFDGDVVRVQNSIIFLDECENFNPKEINKFRGPRKTHGEDGRKISEWNTDLNSVLAFYDSLR